MMPSRPITLYRPEYASVRIIQCSPPSWMVEIALEEKELPYAVMRLSFENGEHRTPEMLARNPRGTIPVLTDGDAVLWESLAILEYLELTYPTPPLLGQNARSRACTLNRLHESAELKRTGMALFAYIMRTAEPDLDHQHLARMRRAFADELGWWERYYGEGAWAAGEDLSLVDLAVFVYVATAVRLGLRLEDAYPCLHSMLARMRARASVQATWPTTWGAKPPARLVF